MEPSQTPAAAPSICRLCGGPAGPSEECPGCERELDAYLASLLAERPEGEEIVVTAAPPPEPPITERPSARPSRRRGRRLLIAAAIGSMAVAGFLAVSGGDEGGTSTAPAPEQAADRPTPTPATPPPAQRAEPAGFGHWSGQGRVDYEDGTRDRFNVTLRIGRLEPGKVVGTAATRQNGTECRGSLTSLGRLDGVFRFAYRERNTAECVSTSRIQLTFRGDHRVAYEEATKASVNRAILTRE